MIEFISTFCESSSPNDLHLHPPKGKTKNI